MAKYVIHACQQRKWYVDDYLIPSMLKQGINKDDITIWLDDKHQGNLFACMNCFKSMPDDDKGTWHLQDDIMICSDFKQRTEELENKMPIVCGFCFRTLASPGGFHSAYHMWYSFQCIKIDNQIARECAKWFFEKGRYDSFPQFVKNKNGDDSFFKEFIKRKYKKEKIALNVKPNLVEHIDEYIGGSIVNEYRQWGDGAVSFCFNEQEEVKKLTNILTHRNDKVVVYSGTRNLYPRMLAPIRSLLVNTKGINKIYLLIQDDEFPQPLPPQVETINVSNQEYFRRNGPNMRNPWGYMVLLRAAYYDLFPQHNKILSLDVDTIVLKDISPLWDIDMSGYYFAGVKQPEKSKGGRQYRSPLYVNFGVTMHNLAKLRDGTGAKAIAALNNQRYLFSEQDYFNLTCYEKIKEIDPSYNDTHYFDSFNITTPTADPKILHYAAIRDYYNYPEFKKYQEMKISAGKDKGVY